ncbi:MAG: histone-like nucleoid-structuring protein Lsr2 [Streptosporangiaceae bacterium]
MATQTTVTITCDVCGGTKNASTRKLTLDGTSLEIDLCGKDSRAFDKMTGKYIPFARKVRASHAHASNGRGTASSRVHSAAVREWARAQGLNLNDRGRIPSDIERQYEEAH